jgi:rhamnose utilization protein RhaD (predicted bifunctional aldolase and dehydrogenase)
MSATLNTWSEPGEMKDLRELSARLASNRLLVQASSGNVSTKLKHVMWIKASGKWFADAESADFLIPVELARARSCLDRQRAIPETEAAGGPCASIETAMHAVLPHKVVVHVHSVNAIAWAVRADAPRQLSQCLAGIEWQWIPYTQSGVPLAKCVKDAYLRDPDTQVFLLGNHGLVVCGESCDKAERLLEEVEKCLSVEPRSVPERLPPAANREVSDSGWCAPECESIHALATDPVSRGILAGGVLYPCQALFLPSTVCVPESSPLKQMPFFRHRRRPVLIDDQRVLCSTEMTCAEREMLFGLTDVVQRIHPSAPVRYLSLSEVRDVLHSGGGDYLAAACKNRMRSRPAGERCDS